MKLNIQTDFTQFPRAAAVVRAAEAGGAAAQGTVALAHDERTLRRRVVATTAGEKVLVDLLEPAELEPGDLLALEDGRRLAVAAAAEEVHEVRGRDAAHTLELAWHLGGRHADAAMAADRILVQRDPALKAALEGLGATVSEAVAPFTPLRGHGHHHHHDHDAHGHGHHHDHDHGHGEHGHGGRDAYGRLPGDPHYGHNHP